MNTTQPEYSRQLIASIQYFNTNSTDDIRGFFNVELYIRILNYKLNNQ